MDINILFTSIYNKVSLIKSFKRAYSDLNIKGQVFATDIDNFGAGLYVADEGVIVPRLDDFSFLSKMLEICKQKDICAVIPTRDEDLPFFAKNRKVFENKGIKVIVSPYESVTICQDKWRFYNFLVKNKIPSIRTWSSLLDEIEFPCIVKPITGKASVGVEEVESMRGVQGVNFEKNIIQEKVIGKEYTIDYFADFEARVICVVPRARYKVEDGESKIGITKEEPEMVNFAVELGQKLKLIGHNTIQCFKTGDGKIKFLEINPRFGGGAPLGMAAGCKSPEWILRLLKGEVIEESMNYTRDLVMIRHTDNIFLNYEEIDNL